MKVFGFALKAIAVHKQIRELITRWARAVHDGEMAVVLEDHADDIVMFDVPPPLRSRGLEEYRKTWDLFFGCQKPSYAFDIEDIAIALHEGHSEVDPLTIRFTDLHRWVTELPDFDDEHDRSNEKILEAIQAAWIEDSDY